MRFIADFHIHSHYSRATSKKLNPEWLDYWARLKGIKIVGTGDFTHPGWIAELKEKFDPAEQGLFKLKNEFRQDSPIGKNEDVRFILTAEISNIYKKGDKTRKVHNVVFAPDFEIVEKIQNHLTKYDFNITSDGRPILGMDSRDLLEMCLEASDEIFFVPAHIWTPWFSALGSKSGFDTIDECYGDLAHHISAVETGLSSDPPMNWACSFLDRFTIISNSDAHSPEKLGREANLFDTEPSYNAIMDALKTGDPNKFLGTIEMFSQEGKYHFDGHRKCNVCWSPLDTLKHDGICSECRRKVVVGVMNRVAQLSDREHILERPNRHPFYSLIPLKEILSEICGVGPNSKKVGRAYDAILQKYGPELNILLNIPPENIDDELLSEAIRRMRNSQVYVEEGYDGEYGTIKVFRETEIKAIGNQNTIFGGSPGIHPAPKQQLINFDLEEFQKLKDKLDNEPVIEMPPKKVTQTSPLRPQLETIELLASLNPEQRKAAEHHQKAALILAGPGTGKTRVLTYRIAHLIQNHQVNPENILAVTFTNKAANEMKERLANLLNNRKVSEKITVSTFHALGYEILRENAEEVNRTKTFAIFDEGDRQLILSQLGVKRKELKKVSQEITKVKQKLETQQGIIVPFFLEYETYLQKQNAFDLDDLIYRTVKLLMENKDILRHYQDKFQWLLVDEYQDVNFAQYELIRTLMPATDANLCIIGDPNQAIFGFRGADVRFIRQFKNDYSKAITYNLKTSYRCSQSILKASHGIIQQSNILDGLHGGVKINIAKQATDKSEAEFVARTIEDMMGGLGFFSMDSQVTQGDKSTEIESLSDFVVLCRTRGQFPVIEKAFRDHQIPYQTVGTEPFFRQKPISHVIDVVKYVANPDSELLKEKLADKSLPDIQHLSGIKNPQKLLAEIIENYFKEEQEENPVAFKKLMDFAAAHKNIIDFLKFTALGTGTDTYKANLENVTLMTLHAAKGLEFSCVFIAGCEDGLLPYSLFESQKAEISEERRLLYVGMTRAKKILYLTHAQKRFLHGREYQLDPSPFLDKIEKDLIEHQWQEYKKKEKPEERQISLF